jgi:membrane fusion protein, multidrug efflux system
VDTKSRQAEGLTPPAAPHESRPITAPPKKRRSLFSTLLWAGVFALVVIAIVWFALSRSSAPAGPGGGHGGGGGRHGGGGRFGNQPTTVSVAQVGKGDVPIYLNQLGTVTPLATVTVTSQVSGFLQSLGFKEGQMVHKGQFLAQIDPRPYQATLLQAEGALARDRATLAQAELDLKRYRLLLSQDSIASQTVDQQAATVQADQGTVKSDEANVATARLNVQYAHVTSPVEGRAGLRLVDVGNYVSTVANTTATNSLTSSGIVVVTQLTPIDVQFTLPEDNLPQVEARVRAGAKLPVVAYDRTGQTELARGELLTLDNQVDASTGTVRAKARFNNGANTLFPQQFVNVKILVDTLRNAVVAPNNAILRGADGLYVYVVQGGVNHHTASVRNVKTGDTDGTNTAIVSGLNPGETVITDGTDRLREGAPVILPGDCIPMMPGGAGGHGRRHGGGAGGWGGGQGQGPGGGQGGCPKGQTRETAAGAKATAQASAGASAATGPGSAASQDQSTGVQQAPAGGGEAGQGPGQGQGGRMQALLAQLDLDAQQQLKAQAIFTAARGEAMSQAASSGEDPNARRQAMHQAYGKAFDQLAAILRPDQKAKLAQLRAQMQQRQGGGDQGGGQ